MQDRTKKELLGYGLVPLGSIIVAFLIATLVSLFLLQTTISGAHRDALADQAADALQFQINQREGQLLRQAQTAATSIQLTQLVTGDDETARSLEETRLRELIPHAIRIRLFPIGSAAVDRTANPPFSFTSLDMVNKIENGLAVSPEAINANGSWILSVAAPIRSPSEPTVSGTLFVYLEMSALSSGLDADVPGAVRLVQTFANLAPNDILQFGTGESDQVVVRTLNNSNWQIYYTPDKTIADATLGSAALYLTPVLAFLIIAAGGVAFGLFGIMEKLKADALSLADQMSDVSSGTYQASDLYNFSMFLDLDANLARLGKRAEDKPEVTPLNVKLQPKLQRREEMVDIEMIDADEYEREMAAKEEEEADATTLYEDISEIFRAYDIRGIVGETLTPEVIERIGKAIGSEAMDQGEQTLVVGADGRTSSPEVTAALIKGLTSTGCDVVDLGTVPTPVLYYATHNSETRSGVMVTASHNPPRYNGFKIVLDGRTLVEEDIRNLYLRVVNGDFRTGEGESRSVDITGAYLDAIVDDVVVAQPLKVVLDCGNGVAGGIAPELLGSLGCEVTPIYCDVDGTFPNHLPDPLVPENLADLILMVKSERADLGIALDGDGDRLVAITGSGKIVWPDRLLMLFAKDVVSRNPGSDVVYDVKCTRHLNSVISSFGGRPIICRSGHSYLKAKMTETDAVLGGEMSGHICFGERWFGFDDGLYAAARLLEIVGSQTESLEELLAEFPETFTTPEIIVPVAEKDKFGIIQQLVNGGDFAEGTITTIDGLRVDYSDGWGLIRASNTNPALTLRFEADDKDTLENIKSLFRERLQAIDSSLDF